MYAILVYDVNVKRVDEILRICRKYLNHIQNSVFEGEIKESSLSKLVLEIKALIDEKADRVAIFTMRNEECFQKTELGLKDELDNVL